jgi:hypothetical protein
LDKLVRGGTLVNTVVGLDKSELVKDTLVLKDMRREDTGQVRAG